MQSIFRIHAFFPSNIPIHAEQAVIHADLLSASWSYRVSRHAHPASKYAYFWSMKGILWGFSVALGTFAKVLVVEWSPSSTWYDIHDKSKMYTPWIPLSGRGTYKTHFYRDSCKNV